MNRFCIVCVRILGLYLRWLAILSQVVLIPMAGHAQWEPSPIAYPPVVGSHLGIALARSTLLYHYLFGAGTYGAKLYVLDIADPSAPTLVASSDLSETFITDIEVAGRWPMYYVYIVGSSYSNAHPVDERGVSIRQFDATDGQISYVGEFPDLEMPEKLVVQGNRAYITDSYRAFVVMDISDPTHPSELTRYWNYGPISDLVLSGAVAYLAVSTGMHDSGVAVIDISNPHAITEIGRYEMGMDDFDGTGSLTVANGYAFLNFNGPMLSDYYVDIIDLSTMQRAARVVAAWVHQIVVVDRYLFAGGPGVYDISNITAPKALYIEYRFAGNTTLFAGTYVYTTSDGGMQVLDVGALRSDLRHTLGSVVTPTTWGYIKSRFK